MNRAYSLLQVKAADDDKRIIEGIATTPAMDRQNDVIVTEGIEFKLPLPLLYQHNSRQPIGNVVSAKVTKEGLEIKAQLAAAGVATFIDEAWNLIKAGLIRGLSVGFRSLEESYDRETGGFRFLRTELMELSAVTIPANAEATILAVKSADSEARTASGARARKVVILDKPNPPASRQTGTKHMTIKEQIEALEAKRQASDARMDALEKKAADEGRTFSEEETEEYDGLESEVKSVDEHLVRLKKRESRLASTATEITRETGLDPQRAAAARSGVISVLSNIPKGAGMARAAICLMNAHRMNRYAPDLAREHYPDMPGLELYLKAAVQAGDSTTSGWASQLVPAAQQLPNEFLDMLRPQTILGRLNLRQVPFNVAIPVQSAGGTYNWVAEAAGKPVTKLTFTSVTLRWAKAAGIIVITKELAKFSSPSAEMVIRDEMIRGMAQFFDTQFTDPTVAAVSNVSPGSITNGISATPATGATAEDFRYNMSQVLGNFATNNQAINDLVIIMSATNAIGLSLLTNSLGQPEFPGITAQGGTVVGLPVIVSETAGTNVIVLKPSQIFLAEEGGVQIDVSDQATVEMETTPAVGEESPVSALSNIKSFWQNNLIGLRCERFITWARGRDAAVEYISGATYAPTEPA